MLLNSGPMSLSGSAGAAAQSRNADSPGVRRAVGSIGAQYSTGGLPGTLLSLEAGADRGIDSSSVRASGTVNDRLGNARADILHGFDAGASTQYGITLQSAAAASTKGVAIGANALEQSAIIIAIAGDARNVPFTVLVDETPRGRIRSGQRLSLFLPPYHLYKVRLVPAEADPVIFDASTRDVTLYPGNVAALGWKAESYFTVFGQAVAADGRPIADAAVRSARGISETDSAGYFQLDVTRNDNITVGEGARCKVQLAKLTVKNDYAALGKVLCK
jgi:hypothetical protein